VTPQVALGIAAVLAVVAVVVYVVFSGQVRRIAAELEDEKRREADFQALIGKLEKINTDLEQKNTELSSHRENLSDDVKQRDLLLDLTQSLTQTLELDTLLSTMLAKIGKLVPFHSGGVFLYNQDKTDLSVASTSGLWEQEMASQLAPEIGIPAIVAQTNRAQIPDVTNDPRFGSICKSTRIQSALYLPIATEREVYGVLSLWHMEKDAFTREQQGVLATVTSEAARSIKNAEVYQELDTRLNFIVTLWETSKSLTSSVDVQSGAWEKTLEEVVTSTRYLFRTEKAVFFRYNKERRELVPTIIQGLSDAGRAAFGVAVNEGPQTVPFFLQSTFQVKDCLKDNRFANLETVARQEEIRGLLWAPLMGRNMAIGALALMTSKPRVWTTMELQWVEIFAKMFSMTLENIFLFQDLASEKSQLQVLIDNMPEGVFTTDTAGRVLTWNAAASNITGWGHVEMAGKFCSEFIGCHTVDEVWCQRHCPLRISMDTQAKFDSGVDNVFVLRRDGGKVPVFITSAPIHNEEGKITGSILVFRDITKEREIEQMKEDFLATITHDLKSPLASVMGYTELLLNPKLGEINPTQKEFLEAIIRSSKTLQFLIDNILEITRMEAGKMLFNPGLFNLEALVSEIHEMFRPLAAPKQLRMEAQVDESIIVYGDRDKVKEVFINLFSNAIKFTREKGVITVRAVPEERRVAVSVSDTGKGIPRDQIQRLFSKFAQVKSDERRGTGLGLYIIKRIMDAHDETVTVESTEGVGTTFTFGLPRFKPEQNGRSGGDLVLILERDRQMSETVRRTLNEEGINAIQANTARDALQVVQDQRPGIVVIDSQVPEIRADNLLSEMKKISMAAGSHLRVLLICEWREKVPAEADAHIFRPVDSPELLRKLRALGGGAA